MFEIYKKSKQIIDGNDKRKILFYAFLSGFTACVDLLGVAVLFDFFSMLSRGEEKSFVINKIQALLNLSLSVKNHFIYLIVILIIVYGLRAITIFLSNRYLQKLLMGTFISVLKRQLYNCAMLPMTFHLNSNLNELSHKIHAHSIHFVSYFLKPCLSATTELLVISFIFISLIVVEPLPTLFIFIVMSAFVFLYVFIVRVEVRVLNKSLDDSSIKLFSYIRNAMESFKEIKIYGALDYYVQRVFDRSNSYSKNFIKLDQMVLIPKVVFESFVPILIGVVALYLYLTEKDNELIFTRFLFIAMAFARVAPSFSRVTSLISTITSHSISVEIVHDGIFSGGKPEQMIEDPFSVKMGRLTLENVKFSYDNSKEILKGVNLSIESGEKIGIVGRSGAGKSTLLYIILGLLKPSCGRARYSNTSLYNNKNWFDSISYIPQSIKILDSSIEENVAFGNSREAIDKSRVDDALKRACLYDDVKDLLYKNDRSIESVHSSELSNIFSGGQLQRIAIARALYKDTPVLIVDEGTSSLDIETEYNINKSIINSNISKTVVFVSHRINTLKDCDRIYILDQGIIVDSGSFEDLKVKSKWFKYITNLS